MSNNKPDISLEQAIERTKQAGINLSFDKGQTIAEDIFQLKQDIKKANSDIKKIHWIFSVIVIGAVSATLILLADYAQFAIKAYEQFETKITKQGIGQETIKSIQTRLNDLEKKECP